MAWSTTLTTILTVAASFAGTWLAAYFALRRFYRERMWERKTVAYTAIFEALFDMSEWFDKHFNAMIRNRELDDDVKTRLTTDYQAATRMLQRRIAAETWLIPDHIHAVLNDILAQMDRLDDEYDFSRIVTEGQDCIYKGQKLLRDAVRRDLGLEPSAVFQFRRKRR